MVHTRTANGNGNPTKRQRGLARFTDDLEAALFEFVGTVLFLLIALGGVQAVTTETAASGGAASFVVQNL
jgi:aquaporin related protein